MVSITGVAGCFTFGAALFPSPRLGLDLATLRFAVWATFRALLRLAEFPLRSLARLCTFDFFLRLAILAPGWFVFRNQLNSDQKTAGAVRQPTVCGLSTDRRVIQRQ